jgi:predicted  nucleic acid-binding Zn-ribbon protein
MDKDELSQLAIEKRNLEKEIQRLRNELSDLEVLLDLKTDKIQVEKLPSSSVLLLLLKKFFQSKINNLKSIPFQQDQYSIDKTNGQNTTH